MRRILLSLIFSISNFLYFATPSIAVTPNETGAITELQVHRHPTATNDSGRSFSVIINSRYDGISNASCTYKQWIGYMNDESGKAQYSTLLAAYMAGKNVKVEGTEGYCVNDKQLIRNVYLY